MFDKMLIKLMASPLGDARAFGIEFFLKKISGRHKYWIAYTLSKSRPITTFDILNFNDKSTEDFNK